MAGATVNDALVSIGEPKKYQFFILFWSLLAGAMTAMQSLVLNFTQANMSFRCKGDAGDDFIVNQTYGYSAAATNQTLISRPAAAYLYDTCTNSSLADQCTSGYVYNSTYYTSSVVSQFGLVCENTVLTTASNALFMVTRIPAGIASGQLSDRLGRKKAIMIGLFVLGALGLGTAYSVNIYMYIVFHSLLSFPVMAVYDGTATLISEVTSPSKRPAMLIAIVFSWGTGVVLLSPFGYFIRDWRTLQMAISIPPLALFLISYWIYDESPHWLYSQSRYKEAQQVLDKMARWNGCKFVDITPKPLGEHNVNAVTTPSLDEKPNNIDADHSQEALTPESEADSAPSKSILLQIIRSPKFLKIFLVCVFGWLACNMGYTGLAFGLDALSGDPYIVNLIGGSTEYVAYIIAFLIIPGGRKKVYVILMSVGGISLIVNAIILDRFSQNNVTGKDWLIILLTMIGRLSVAACWQILYLWCLELFPTTMRLTMLEVSMIVGHIGSAAAPFINDAHKLIKNKAIRGQIIAPAVYGIFLILSSLTSIYLPETNNKDLPVDLEEAKSNMESTTRNRRREAGVSHDENLSTYM